LGLFKVDSLWQAQPAAEPAITAFLHQRTALAIALLVLALVADFRFDDQIVAFLTHVDVIRLDARKLGGDDVLIVLFIEVDGEVTHAKAASVVKKWPPFLEEPIHHILHRRHFAYRVPANNAVTHDTPPLKPLLSS